MEASTVWRKRFESSYGGLGLVIFRVARLARFLCLGLHEMQAYVEISGRKRIAMWVTDAVYDYQKESKSINFSNFPEASVYHLCCWTTLIGGIKVVGKEGNTEEVKGSGFRQMFEM